MAGDTPVHLYVEGERCLGVRKGAWTKEEDDLLKHCIHKHGEGNWRQVPSRAGLNRCRKSCRMRWLNYLKPDINNGEFKEDEVDLLIRLHKLLGSRWSLIAGRLPGRTSNNVKNYWNTHLRKKIGDDDYKQRKDKDPHEKGIKSNVNVIKPRSRTLSKNLLEMISKKLTIVSDENDIHQRRPQHNLIIDDHETSTDHDPSPAVLKEWWESFKFDTELNEEIFTQSHSWCDGDQTLPSFSIDHHHHQVVPNIGDIINFGTGAQDHQTSWGGYYTTIDMDLWGLLNADK